MDFAEDCEVARKEEELFRYAWRDSHTAENLSPTHKREMEAQYSLLMPDLRERYLPDSMESYPEDHRSKQAKHFNTLVDEVEEWIQKPYPCPADKTLDQWQ
jgi:hypothetical protein